MGKAAIILVLGFSMVLTIILPAAYRKANFAYDNYTDYYMVSQAHNIAASAANIAADSIFWNKNWRTGFSNISFAGGTYSAVVESIAANRIRITATGKFQDSTKKVVILLQPGTFAQFAYYSQSEGSGIYWANGDTVYGRMHTQATMLISGSPVFWGKVTSLGGTNPTKSTAKFYGGYQKGVNIPMPVDLSATVAAGTGGKVYSAGDLWITFKGDSVLWKTSATGAVTRTTLSSYAPNGAIIVSNGNVHVQGTMSGRATVCASSSTSGKGNVYIDDDVLYTHDPRVTTSNDMLGLIAYNSVIVSDNTANGTNCEIDAALFCLKGGLTAENYNRNSPTTPPVIRGRLTLYGGVTQYQRGPVGTLDGSGNIVTGFRKNYTYDNRLQVDYPPFYPMTGSYQIISWLE